MYAPFISKTNHSFSPNASNRNTNFVFICTAYVPRPKQCIKKDLRQPIALITFIHCSITRLHDRAMKQEASEDGKHLINGLSGWEIFLAHNIHRHTHMHSSLMQGSFLFWFFLNKILWSCILNAPDAFPVNQQLFLLITPRTYCGILFVFGSGHVTPLAPGNTG